MAKLLIIEDDPYVLEIYGQTFSRQNYEVVTAKDGEEGLEKAHEHQPSLILLDIMIPKLNGFDVLSRLKHDEKTRHIPVMMLTNLGEEQHIKRAIALGAEGFMIKANFSLEQLTKEVDRKLNKQ
jgi:DNA-binding response OmpR family regulator